MKKTLILLIISTLLAAGSYAASTNTSSHSIHFTKYKNEKDETVTLLTENGETRELSQEEAEKYVLSSMIPAMILCMLMLIPFAVIGIILLRRNKNLEKYGIKTTARVVAMTLKGRPTVEYQTEQGLQKVKYPFDFQGYRIGNLITIYYSKEKPKRFAIEGDFKPIFLGLVFLAIGIGGIVIFGVVMVSFLS